VVKVGIIKFLIVFILCRHFHSSEKYDDYRFVHWSAVDYFCYFSHQYVTIPPSGWLNAAHRHGVPVVGTFIVEAPGLLNEVLATEETVSRTVEALALQHLGYRLLLHAGQLTYAEQVFQVLYGMWMQSQGGYLGARKDGLLDGLHSSLSELLECLDIALVEEAYLLGAKPVSRGFLSF